MTDGTRNRNPWLRFGTAVIMALLCVGIAAPVFAQGQYQFSQRNLKKIQKVFEFLQLEGTDEEVDAARGEAKDILLGMNLKRAKPYGRARILCTLGAISVQDGQNEEALDYLERCVAEEALQPEEQLKNLFMVGQLQTMLGNYDDAIVTLESWIAQVETPSPSSYYTLAVTYYQAERAAEADAASTRCSRSTARPPASAMLPSASRSTRFQCVQCVPPCTYTAYGSRSGPSAESSRVEPSMKVPSAKTTSSP